jgi:hypothetical protein
MNAIAFAPRCNRPASNPRPFCVACFFLPELRQQFLGVPILFALSANATFLQRTPNGYATKPQRKPQRKPPQNLVKNTGPGLAAIH